MSKHTILLEEVPPAFRVTLDDLSEKARLYMEMHNINLVTYASADGILSVKVGEIGQKAFLLATWENSAENRDDAVEIVNGFVEEKTK